MSPPPAELLEARWIIPVFALFWLGVCGMLSLLSGWSSLAARFQARHAAQGESFRFVSGSIGARRFPVNYGNCLFVSVSEQGLHLRVFFMFRLFSPPLFIPWSQVESVTGKRLLFMRYAAVRIRQHWATVSIYGRAGKSILATYESLSGKAD